MANNIFGNWFKGKDSNTVEQSNAEAGLNINKTVTMSPDDLSDEELELIDQNPENRLIINNDIDETRKYYSNLGSKELATLPKKTIHYLRNKGLIDEELLRDADARLAAEEKKFEAELRREPVSVNLDLNPSNTRVESQVEVPKKELTPEEKIAKLEEQVSSLTDAMKTQQELIKQLMTHTNVIQTSNEDITTYNPNEDDNNKSK